MKLIDEGSTVPFIARYRKEATGGLDDTQLRTLAERLIYLRELDSRRAAILDSIRSQGKLTDALEAQIGAIADQGRTRRPLSALQAEAPHQGGDRARARPRAARRRDPRRSHSCTRRARGGLCHRRNRRREGRARRRARHRRRDDFRQRRPARPPARLHARQGGAARQTRRGPAGGGRQILRLFRSQRTLGRCAEPSRAGHAARPQRRRADARSRSRRRRSRADEAGRADDRRGLSGRRHAARRSLVEGRRALDLAGKAVDFAVARSDG